MPWRASVAARVAAYRERQPESREVRIVHQHRHAVAREPHIGLDRGPACERIGERGERVLGMTTVDPAAVRERESACHDKESGDG